MPSRLPARSIHIDQARARTHTYRMNPLLLLGTIAIAIAGLFHIAIFVLESVLWSRPSIWRRFGVRSQAEADVVAPMAFNQGFYNLFLAAGSLVGVVLVWLGSLAQAGVAVALFAAASMTLAALVLVLSNRRLARAAAMQGALPFVGVVLVLLSLL